MRPIIALAMGDPAGISPELTARERGENRLRSLILKDGGRIFRLECLFELGLGDAAGAAGVTRVLFAGRGTLERLH